MVFVCLHGLRTTNQCVGRSVISDRTDFDGEKRKTPLVYLQDVHVQPGEVYRAARDSHSARPLQG